MSEELQISAGFVIGLTSGLAFGLLRPLLRLALLAAPAATAVMLYHAGVPGILAIFSSMVAEVRTFAPFFAALGIAKLLGAAIAPAGRP